MFFQQFLVRVRKLFPDHDTGLRGPGQVPGDDNETRVLHHWVPRHNYRPQIISSSHTSQNNQPLNTINNPDQQTTVNLCLSRTTQSYRVASAFIQFERKLFPFLYLTLHNYTIILASIFHLGAIITQVSFHLYGSSLESQGSKVKWRGSRPGMNYSNLTISGQVILGYKSSDSSLHFPDFQWNVATLSM